jgi:DNA-binding transcriptional MerR regulator
MSEAPILLTQDEAAKLAGVGHDTIERYRDLGLLRMFNSDKGEERFSEEDIKLLFNGKIKSFTSSPDSRAESHPIKIPDNIQDTKSSKNKTPLANKIELDSTFEEELPRLKDIIREVEHKNLKESPTIRLSNPVQTSQESTSSSVEDNFQSSKHIIERQNNEISSIELLELTRTLKDQLEIVKEERNWLRKRIEKLESLSEREQMLRMSESDTIRTLIAQREPKKSPWSFLLSWTKPKETNKEITSKRK